jgi:hypothetical protein
MMNFGGERWLFHLGNGIGGNYITGQLSYDGSTFAGESMHYGNGLNDGRAHPFTWNRVAGASCAASLPSQDSVW